MNAPAVQFVTTRDGVRIACAESGSGFPFVLTSLPFNNLRLMWSQHTDRSLFDRLAARFRLIQYDSRGMGLSQRGLPPTHSYDHYLLDVEAVVAHFSIDRFILWAGVLSGHAAIRYAVEHPLEVAALILVDVPADAALNTIALFESAAAADWDGFLATAASWNRLPDDLEGDRSIDYYRATMTQADFISMVRSVRPSNVESLLPLVPCPTLVLASQGGPRETVPGDPARYERLAASIPGARLVPMPGRLSAWYSLSEADPPMVKAIDDFVAILGLAPAPQTAIPLLASGGLTTREAEVLSLIAAGLTNQQIADQLVISVRTVERHINHIYDKISVSNRAQATAYALNSGVA